jgi:hypothetical protein
MTREQWPEREPGVDAILAERAGYISARPELVSLLYDIDMLPEQCVTRAGAVRLAGLCAVWERMEKAEKAAGGKLPVATGLTERQLDVLRYLTDYIAKHQISPTYDEICHAMGLHSKSGVHRLLNGLVQRGCIAVLPGKWRSIELLASPPAAPEAEETVQ